MLPNILSTAQNLLHDLFVGFNHFVAVANTYLWGYILVALLIGAGLLFTVLTRFIQIRSFWHTIVLLATSRKGASGGISSFQAFSTSLAARVGTGNLAGVALAITVGGPGAVFWMWVTSIVGMSTSFIESILAQTFKVHYGDKSFRGGPAYYIEQGLGQRWLGIIFAMALVMAFGFAFNGAQANSIAKAVVNTFGPSQYVTPTTVGLLLVLLVAPVIFGGLRSVARVAEFIVPLMAIAYIVLALIVVIYHIEDLPGIFSRIINDAFSPMKAAAGVGGWFLSITMQEGIKRGLFANEAGMGSAPNAAATATTEPNHPAVQGYVQMLGVFIDTMLICTSTAAIILLSGSLGTTTATGVELTGVKLTQVALSQTYGNLGSIFVSIAIFFFAFTSIIANYSYSEVNIGYIFKNRHPVMITVYRLLVLGMVFVGAIANLKPVWAFADLSMGVMALINLTSIILLCPIALLVLRDYEQQRKDKVKSPVFIKSKYPKLSGKIAKGVWTGED